MSGFHTRHRSQDQEPGDSDMSKLDLNPRDAAALSQLLDQALDLAPGARESWLSGLPAEHAALKPLAAKPASARRRRRVNGFPRCAAKILAASRHGAPPG